MAHKRLIIDTDMGVDDAHALLMALTHPEVEVLGITTVMGNVGLPQVVQNVGHVLDLLQMDIPFYRGALYPLIGEPIPPSGLMGMDGLGDATIGMPAPSHQPQLEAAALALVRMVKEAASMGDFTLVALGPLTNLALALHLMPDFAASVPHLVIMGGAYKAMGNASWTAEFNFFADPEAARVVLEAGFADVWLLPWEVSVEQMILWPDYDELIAMPGERAAFFECISRVSAGVLRDQFRWSGMPCPDQLAMAVALDPQAVAADVMDVRTAVEVEGKWGRGMLAIDWNRIDGSPNAHLVTRVHQDVALKMMRAGL